MKSFPLILLAMLVYCWLISLDSTLADARRDEPFWSNPLSRFPNTNKRDSAAFRNPEFHQPNEEWERYSDYSPPRPRWNNRKKAHPKSAPAKHQHQPSRNHGQPSPIAGLVDELFPGFKFITTRSPSRPLPKQTKFPADEIHVEIDDVKDLSNILNYEGYDDIVLSITQQDSPPLPGKDNTSKEKSKPFWGPPILISTTRPPSIYSKPFKQPSEKTLPRTIPSRAEEDFSVYHTSTVSNVWDLTTPGPKAPEGKNNNIYDQINNNTPTESFWGPLHTPASPYGKEHELDPFDLQFWDRATATESTYFINPTSPEAGLIQSKSSPHYGYEALEQTPGPYGPLHLKEIEAYEHGLVPYSPPIPKEEHHVVYHRPTSNHFPGLAQVDFSPIFLALIPLALVLGAAASFALASAVTSNTAVATAQQQQQQEESSNSNNNANNNNDNSFLSLLAAFTNYQNNNNQPYIIIINSTDTGTTTTTMAPPPPPSFRVGQEEEEESEEELEIEFELDDDDMETTTMMSYGRANSHT